MIRSRAVAVVMVERRVECASSAEALWPHVTDTERLNRAIGLTRTELTPNDDPTAARYVVRTVSGGFPLEYEEQPFEWVEPRRFSVRRIGRRGLAKTMENTFLFESRPDGGTDVVVRLSLDPKPALIGPIARIQMARVAARMAAEIRRIDAALMQETRPGAASHAAGLQNDEIDRLAGPYLDTLDGDERAAGLKLLQLLKHAPDLDVDRIRPYELADAWKLDRDAVLGACLHGVGAGLFELTWDLVCPSCRTASERMRTLSELGAHAHCQLCDISFDMDLDRAVEATFRPRPALRRVDEGPYCVGGPARMPHVLAQTIVPASGSVELSAPTKSGRYRLFVRGGPAAILRVVEGGAEELRAVAGEGTLDPAQADVIPGARIVLSQTLGRERHAKIERVDWARAAATAHQVSMLPAFRRQFAREVLRPGLTLRISRVALLFTDLTGSTALYTRVGDAKAFGVVQDHFELLTRLIAERHGTIVKTIGDAVMAAFPGEEEAVRAAVAMHRAFPEFRRTRSDAEDVKLKIGVHSGPCYAVTANGVLDYFGQSVNIAARLQGAAGAGELVVAKELAEAAHAAGWLDPELPHEPFQATLKGLSEPLAALRVRID
jgi:adenylate cyclase